MPLTEEQRERIRKNRERALQLQQERKERLEKEENNDKKKRKESSNIDDDGKKSKKSPPPGSSKKAKREKGAVAATSSEDKNTPTEMEQFEEGASDWVTKREATTIYCLPEGTLAVCEFEERDNPHNAKWKPMKLFRRQEIRERAHKRYGGLDGL
ncbi:MAG: hypothetical protein SGARI_005695, partial [Bacillariaceae sp.]